jgi:hypothetical protein
VFACAKIVISSSSSSSASTDCSSLMWQGGVQQDLSSLLWRGSVTAAAGCVVWLCVLFSALFFVMAGLVCDGGPC